MKRLLACLTLIGICFICTAQENAQVTDAQGRPLPAPVHRLAAGEIMTFPYATNLEWCIRMSFEANGIPNPYTTPITGSLIEQIKHISCYSPVPKVTDLMFNTNNNNSVTSLEGIEYFYNLETLTINGTSEITDL